MNRGLSIYLDALRAVAALTVFASHFAYERFSGGGYLAIRDFNLGSDAVVVFFVMSGFLIAYAAERAQSAGTFVKARAARLYCVVLPAIALTLICDAVGRAADPTLYVAPWDQQGPIIAEILRAVSFTNEFWFDTSRLGTNGPYWSIAYEAWYYALFAAWSFTRGWRRYALIGAGAIFIGPRILLLAPCWIAGVCLYRIWRRGPPPISRPLALLFMFIPVAAYVGLQWLAAPRILYAAQIELMGLTSPFTTLGFSDEFLWNYVIAGLVAIHLYGVMAAPKLFEATPERIARVIRWPARRSFSLYLYHYPLLSCLAAISPLARESLFHHAFLVIGVLAASFALAEFTECRLGWWKKRINDLTRTGRTRDTSSTIGNVNTSPHIQ